jgi:hypothetical protein
MMIELLPGVSKTLRCRNILALIPGPFDSFIRLNYLRLSILRS